jgi:hypothetical protein
MDEIMEEKASWELFKQAVSETVRLAAPFKNWGDGEGGAVLEHIARALHTAGIVPDANPRNLDWAQYEARPTMHRLARQVMERDAYRCRRCGSWIDLTIDHIKPISLGGEDDPANLQTLCRSCNSRKGASND